MLAACFAWLWLGFGAGWLAAHGISGSLQTASTNDGDRFCLVTEYLFGLDPSRADASSYSVSSGPEDRIVIEWNALSSGARYAVEQSENLRDWTVVNGLEPAVELGSAGPKHRRMQVSVRRSGSSGFYRVRAELE